jgi:uncharacterized protein
MISPVKIWRNQKYVTRMIGKTGMVTSWTVIRVPPADFGYQAPYPVAIIALDDGESLCAQMVDYTESDLVVGRRVIIVVRRTMQSQIDGIIQYGIKVKPI